MWPYCINCITAAICQDMFSFRSCAYRDWMVVPLVRWFWSYHHCSHLQSFLILSVEFKGSHHQSHLPFYFHILSPLPNLFLSVEYEWDPDINIMIHLPLYYPYLYCWIWRGASEVPLSISSFPSFTLSFCYLFILKGDSGILSLCYLSNLKGDSGGPLHLVNQGVFTQVNLP